MRKNILLLSYAISPSKGSEYSVAWNHVKFMSKYHNIHVIYGSSSDKFADPSEIKAYLENNPIENVTFHDVSPGKLSKYIFKIKKKLEWNSYARYILYICFSLWHKDAYKYAKKLVKEQSFDLVHFLGPIGYREPGNLWKLGLPYIRGPVGGTYQRPYPLFKALRKKDQFIFYIRNAVNWMQLHFSCKIARSIKKTDVLLTSTRKVQADFKRVYNKENIYIAENSITEIIGLNKSKFDFIQKEVQLIWIGRIDANKALIILLRAINKIPVKNYKLHIVGKDANMSGIVKKYVQDNDLTSQVIFHGAVTRNEVFTLMNESHLHIITSMSEGNPTTVWEAMSLGVPTLTFDHCGMADIITEKSGKKIPITTYEESINNMASALGEYLQTPSQLELLANNTIKEAENYTWEKRIQFFNDLYLRF